MIYETKAYKVFKVINITILLTITALTLYPFMYMFAVSFSSSNAVLSGEVSIIPVDFSILSYKEILAESKFWLGYRNTIFYTTMGTSLSVILTVMCAYPLSKKSLYGNETIIKLIVFTMFFEGGLIPMFLVVKSLGMVDTVWAIIVPGLINAYNVLIMKTFFQGIPQSLEEAGEIDGLGRIGVLWHIVLPLSKPIIATIALFNAVWYWNDWFQALIYLNNDMLYPVTMYLRNIMLGQVMSASGQSVNATAAKSISQTLQAASTMLVIFPMLIIYPFVQKYFVKGVMIGSVKG